MFEDILSVNFVELLVLKWPGKNSQIMDDIDSWKLGYIVVQPAFLDDMPATEVEFCSWNLAH